MAVITGKNGSSKSSIPVIIGDVTIHAQVLNPGYGIDNVSFYIDDQLFYTDYEYPFTFLFYAKQFGRTKFDVVLSDSTNQQNKNSLILWKFF